MATPKTVTSKTATPKADAPKETNPPKEPKEAKEPKEPKETKEPKDPKKTKKAKKAKKAKEPKEPKDPKDPKKRHRKPKYSWNMYVVRSLKSINKQMSMSSRTVRIMNSFVNDIFERIASEAAHLVRTNKRRTLGARELQTAVRLVLPPDVAKHAMAEGTKAVSSAVAEEPTS